MDMGYSLRILDKEDVMSICSAADEKMNRLFGAPSRYYSENVDGRWYMNYTKNYGSAVRCSILDENEDVCGAISLTDIDFLAQKARLNVYIKESTQSSLIKQSAVMQMLGYAAESLKLTEIFYENTISESSLLEKIGFLKLRSNKSNGSYLFNCKENCMSHISINAKLPFYCIDTACIADEKQYILDYFDKDMFSPISQNPAYKNIVTNIIIAADMIFAYNAKLLGFAALYANDVKTREAFISIIVVSSEIKRKGIGRALIEACRGLAIMRGMRCIKLEVAKENQAAIDFYFSLGFQKTGEDFGKSNILILPL